MLETKHNISRTPVSLVTDFMSNIEFFSRYKYKNCIFGMSVSLGLEEHSSMKTILIELYNTKVCIIPTFRARKLIEKTAIFVEYDKVVQEDCH